MQESSEGHFGGGAHLPFPTFLSFLLFLSETGLDVAQAGLARVEPDLELTLLFPHPKLCACTITSRLEVSSDVQIVV